VDIRAAVVVEVYRVETMESQDLGKVTRTIIQNAVSLITASAFNTMSSFSCRVFVRATT